MTSALERLAGPGKSLSVEAPDAKEFEGLKRAGLARLRDASNRQNSLEGRFDLAYNAAHALSLAALRWHGYRSENRYLVFQSLTHTLALEAAQWRVLDQAHNKRNLAEYEGDLDVDDALVEALVRVAQVVAERVKALGPVAQG